MKMQKIIKGQELQEYIDLALSSLSDAVKTTIGPNGHNVIINTSEYAPFITNDGVTIAEAISAEDEITNTILTLIKEAALKTDSDIGDGTTTTIVLLESIYKSSIATIKDKSDTLKLKEDLQRSGTQICNLLKKYSKTPSNEDLKNIASIAANDEDIADLITKFYLSLDKSDNIKIYENTLNSKDYVQKLQGYFLDDVIASPYFFKDQKSITNPIVILFNTDITDIPLIQELIYNNKQLNKDLIIMADSFTDEVINTVLAINYEEEQNIILLNNPEYGSRKIDILNDIKTISQATNINNYYQGSIKECKIDTNRVLFIYDYNPTTYIQKLQENLKNIHDEYEQNFIMDRLSKLTCTYGQIFVGGATTLERREKKMRFTDALCALNASKYGVITGSAIPFYQISEELDSNTPADAIMAKALTAPLIQILTNSNVDVTSTIKKIQDSNYQIIFNAKRKTFESITTTNVLDNLKVLEIALTNATSIAALLLTTSHLVINTPKASNLSEL